MTIQTAEPGFNAPVVYIVGDSKGLVEVSLSLELIVCFDNRVEEVRNDYGDEYAPPMLHIYCGAELRLRVADTSNGHIVYSLDPAAHQLHRRLVLDNIEWPSVSAHNRRRWVLLLTFGRKIHPM